MPDDRDFKRLVRARMEQGGETYTEARSALRPEPEGSQPDRPDTSPSTKAYTPRTPIELLQIAQETMARISLLEPVGAENEVHADLVIGLLEILFPTDAGIVRPGRTLARTIAADDGRPGEIAPDGRQLLRAWRPDPDAPSGIREMSSDEIEAL